MIQFGEQSGVLAQSAELWSAGGLTHAAAKTSHTGKLSGHTGNMFSSFDALKIHVVGWKKVKMPLQLMNDALVIKEDA